MKKFITLLTLTLSLGAFAQERVILNQENISVNSDTAILVRTSETPSTVHVTFQVRMANSVCERYDQRPVIITSSLECGQDRFVQRLRGPDVCVRRNPHNNQCLRTEPSYTERVTYRTRSCTVLRTECVSYGTNVQTESDQVKIKFKGLPSLGGTEEDTFLVKAGQKNYDGSNVVYDITPVDTKTKYVVKSRGLFGSDSYVIKED
jgi:hypothetical protein